jgi:hypothetical protein
MLLMVRMLQMLLAPLMLLASVSSHLTDGKYQTTLMQPHDSRSEAHRTC